jgi:hypothetical protein
LQPFEKLTEILPLPQHPEHPCPLEKLKSPSERESLESEAWIEPGELDKHPVVTSKAAELA